MSLKVEEAQVRKKAATQKSQKRRAQGVMFLEAAIILPMAAVITFGVAYYANAYVTKTRLADNARVIARAIQDDPTISQGNWGGSLGDLDRVILAATGNGDPVPEGFNVATYKSCNADLSSMSDAQAQEHFARAGRYERREGAFGNCNERRDVGARDTVVNIQSYAEQPTDSQIKAQFPYRFVPNPERGVAAPQADGWHPSGRNTNVPGFGWSYANPNTDKTKPYWISVVAKKPVRQLSLFGFEFGTTPEIANYVVVRVVPVPMVDGAVTGGCAHSWGGYMCSANGDAICDTPKRGCNCPNGQTIYWTGNCDVGTCLHYNSALGGNSGTFHYLCVRGRGTATPLPPTPVR